MSNRGIPLHKQRPEQHSYPQIGEGPVIVTVQSNIDRTIHEIKLDIWDGRLGGNADFGPYSVVFYKDGKPKVRFDAWKCGARVGGGLWKT